MPGAKYSKEPRKQIKVPAPRKEIVEDFQKPGLFDRYRMIMKSGIRKKKFIESAIIFVKGIPFIKPGMNPQNQKGIKNNNNLGNLN
jgi:hypothetical protein